MKAVAAVLALIVVLGLSILVRTSAPCSFWSHAKASDVPARCLKDFR